MTNKKIWAYKMLMFEKTSIYEFFDSIPRPCHIKYNRYTKRNSFWKKNQLIFLYIDINEKEESIRAYYEKYYILVNRYLNTKRVVVIIDNQTYVVHRGNNITLLEILNLHKKNDN